MSKYTYLQIEASEIERIAFEVGGGITIHVKMDDEGVVVDAWAGEDEVIASTWRTYDEMGIEVRELLTIEKQQIAKEDKNADIN